MKRILWFFSKINKTSPEKCWEWQGGRCARGLSYGTLSMPLLGERRTHRVSWVIHNGEIPKGLCVLHRCDNPPCVNPEHLFLGTRTDNAKDRDLKGRYRNRQMKQTRCIRGHEFNEENTRLSKSGKRSCKTCENARVLEGYYKNHRLNKLKMRDWYTKNAQTERKRKLEYYYEKQGRV